MASVVFLLTICIAFCNASLRDYQEDYYNSYYKKEDFSTIPQLGSSNPMMNLGGEKMRGAYFMDDLVKATGYKTTVFKIQVERERLVLSDPIAVRAMYDIKKIIKTTKVSVLEFNLLSTGGYVPSFLDNGISHNIKKIRQYYVMKQGLHKYGLLKAFRHMQTQIEAIYVDSTEPVDISEQIGQMNQDTMLELLLGKPLNDYPLFRQWFATTLTVIKKLDPTHGSKFELYKQLHEKVIAFIRSTPVGQQIKNAKEKDTLEKELLFFTFWLSAGGVEPAMKAVFHYWKDLPLAQQQKIKNEARRFLSSGYKWNFEKQLKHRVPLITKFVMEVLRLDTPVTSVFGIARKDFVLTSMSGRFLVKKGAHIQGNVLSAQRNPTIFKESAGFSMARDKKKVERNFFAFGGPYSQRTTVPNHKCIGQELAINFLRMLVLQITQCDFKVDSAVSIGPQTGLYAIKVKKFKCY